MTYPEIATFLAANPELEEAMRIFGITVEQYARAMAALTRVPTFTAGSTDPASTV